VSEAGRGGGWGAHSKKGKKERGEQARPTPTKLGDSDRGLSEKLRVVVESGQKRAGGDWKSQKGET